MIRPKNRLTAVISVLLLGVAFTASPRQTSVLRTATFSSVTPISCIRADSSPRSSASTTPRPLSKACSAGAGATSYESYLTVSADGSVVVHEYGGGAENRFSPVGFRQLTEKAVDMIAGAAQKRAPSEVRQLASYKVALKSDATFRNDEWEKFRGQWAS